MKKVLCALFILSALSLTACSTMQANNENNQATKQQGSYLGTNIGVGFVAI